MGSQRVRHDWATSLHSRCLKIAIFSSPIFNLSFVPLKMLLYALPFIPYEYTDAFFGSSTEILNIMYPTKIHVVKAMVFPIVVYGRESWTIKKAKHWRTDAFELWCWRRLFAGSQHGRSHPWQGHVEELGRQGRIRTRGTPRLHPWQGHVEEPDRTRRISSQGVLCLSIYPKTKICLFTVCYTTVFWH